jgi:nitroreductase
MDIIEAIFTRRSIRRFTGDVITEKELQTVLRAAFSSPSCGNTRPWHFIIIRNKSKIEQIAKLHNYAKMLPEAGCAIIVCGDTERLGSEGFLIQDCSAAIENMLLAIHGINLGAVWCGLHPNTEVTKPLIELLDIPSTIIPVGMVVVGHKAEEKEALDRFDESRIHYDQW